MRYLFLCLCCCLLTSAGAQIHQPNQRFFEAGGGLLDGVQIKKEADSGYWLKVSLGKYGKKEGAYQIGLMAQRKYLQHSEALIVVNQYFVKGTFAPKAFATADRLFYLNPVLGLLIGYEGTGKDATFSSDSFAVKPNKFLVGFTGGLSSEWNMNRRTALMLYARANYLPSSVIEPLHFQYGLAIRFNYFKP